MASWYPATAIDEQNWLIEVVKVINSVFNPRKSFLQAQDPCWHQAICHTVSLAGVKYKNLSILGHQAHACNKHKLYFGTKPVPKKILGRRELYKVINLGTSGPCLQQAKALFWHQAGATKFPWQVCAGSTLGLSADSFIGWQGILSGGRLYSLPQCVHTLYHAPTFCNGDF